MKRIRFDFSVIAWSIGILGLLQLLSANAAQADQPQDSMPVTVSNYLEAKTALHFARVHKLSGGVNKWLHIRQPVPLDKQRVERMNRDTLYSSALVDVSQGAKLYLPQADGRYLSAAVINQSHHLNRVFHGPGPHELAMEDYGSPHVLVTVRILVDSENQDDLLKVNALQDQLKIESQSAKEYQAPHYDAASLTNTTKLLAELASSLTDAVAAYGPQNKVDKVKHLLATAYGWGGLPETEAYYINSQTNLAKRPYSMTFDPMPVDGFWSISVYNKAGYFAANEHNKYSLNSLTAKANIDGSYRIHFGGEPNAINHLPITDGWSYVIRLYQPHDSVLAGDWVAPELVVLD